MPRGVRKVQPQDNSNEQVGPVNDTFPQEIYVYEERPRGRSWARTKRLATATDINALASARGREVAIYKLVKTVTARRKTTVSVNVE